MVLSHVLLFGISWTVALQAPLSMGFSRQEYWSELLFPTPGDLPDPGIEFTVSSIDSRVLYHWATWVFWDKLEWWAWWHTLSSVWGQWNFFPSLIGLALIFPLLFELVKTLFIHPTWYIDIDIDKDTDIDCCYTDMFPNVGLSCPESVINWVFSFGCFVFLI